MEVYLQRQTGRKPIVIDEFTSLRWRRKYYDVGEFELHITNNASNLFETTTDIVYVWFKGSVERGVVETVTVTRDEIALTGRFESKNMIKTVVQKLIANKAAPLVMAQAFSGSTDNQSSVTDSINVQWRWNTLYDIEKSIARAYNIGFYQLENTLYLYDGIDRSVNQSSNKQVVFLDDDLLEPTWTLDDTNYYSLAYVAGQGEGDERVFISVGSGSDQIYVDARDLAQEDQSLQEYQAQLAQRGIEALAEKVKVDTFESAVSTGSQYKYQKDYNLGDIVTIQMSAWNKTQNFRITEVEEVWERGIYTVYPTFGDPLPEKLMIQGW